MQDGKRTHLFWKYPRTIRGKLQMDNVASYSVTPSKYAEQIARIVADFVVPTGTVIDAMACVGGDTAQLANVFSRVIAIEKDRGRYDMLVHNLPLMTRKRVETVHGDFLEWWRKTGIYVDGFYLDPPWENECQVNGVSIWDVCREVKQNCGVVVLKLPPTFEVEVEAQAETVLRNSRGKEKMKIVVV